MLGKGPACRQGTSCVHSRACRAGVDPAIVFGKLVTAGWHGWSGSERAALEAFLAAWWARTLAGPQTAAGTVLCCLGGTEVDLDPFLERWGRLETISAVRHLHEFVLHEVRWTGGPRPADAFWDRRGAAFGQVVAWLTDGRAAAAVETAFAAATREDALQLPDEIHPVLR